MVYATVKALVAIGLFGMVAIGFLFTRMTLVERVVTFLAALCLLGEFQYSDWVGFALAIAIVAWQWRQRRASRGGSGLSLCLISAGVTKTLAVAAFTLVWTHSIEKIDWQEDWRVTPQGLELVQARVKGSGAGMEPPPEARLVDGWFQWRPKRAPIREVVLGNSGLAGEWRL